MATGKINNVRILITIIIIIIGRDKSSPHNWTALTTAHADHTDNGCV